MSINKYNPTTGELELLAGGVSNSYAPIGAIYPYGGSSAPSGYLLCNGQAVSRNDYSALFAVIGTSFGAGDGSTTFNLPDLRETVPVGSGTRGNGVTDHDTYTVGQFKDDQKQTHTHTISHTHTRGTMDITGSLTNYNATNAASGYYNASGAFVHNGITGSYAHSPVPSGDINVEGIDFIASRNWTGNTSEPSNANSGNDTGRTGTTTHGKQLGVNYIIKAKDVNLSGGGQTLADRVSELEAKIEELILGGVIEADTLPAVPDNYIYNVKNATTIGALFSDILDYSSISSGNEYIKNLSKYYISGNASVWQDNDEWGKRISGTLIFDVPITVPEMVVSGYTFPAGEVSKINIRDGEWNSGGYDGCEFVYTDGSVVGSTGEFGLNRDFSQRADQIIINVPKVYSKGTQLVTMQDFNIFKNTIS